MLKEANRKLKSLKLLIWVCYLMYEIIPSFKILVNIVIYCIVELK